MKKLVFLLAWIALAIPALAQGSGTPSVPPITITEADGSPKVTMPTKIVFPNGSLSITGKTATITFSGSGGTTINSTNGQLPYRVNSTTFGDSALASNALNSTYLSLTSGASGAGVIATVAGGGTNEALILKSKAAASITLNTNSTDRWSISSAGHFLAVTDYAYDIGQSGANRPRSGYFSDSVQVGSAGWFFWFNRAIVQSPADGVIQISNNARTDFDRLQFACATASCPALKRSGAGLELRLADDSALAALTASNITATGGNAALGNILVNSNLALWGTTTRVLRLADTAFSTGATVASAPDSPTQLTADQNNYAAGTGRSLFYRLSSDASRTITGLNPAGGTNQDGELHYIINVGANNIILANESASSTAANRFTNVTGADITLAANEIAMLIYDNTSARWRVAKM